MVIVTGRSTGAPLSLIHPRYHASQVPSNLQHKPEQIFRIDKDYIWKITTNALTRTQDPNT